MANTFAAGQRLTAELLNGVTALLPVTYVKTSSTARTSTTTFADDPELAGIALDVGTYEIELFLEWTQTTTATQKIKTHWSFTGTWSNQNRVCIGAGSAQTAAPSNATEVQLAAYRCDDQDAVYCQAAGGTYGIARELCGNLVVTVAGTMALSWAQSASSANATTVRAGSWFNVRKTA